MGRLGCAQGCFTLASFNRESDMSWFLFPNVREWLALMGAATFKQLSKYLVFVTIRRQLASHR
jgi:hypothetical protein